MLKRINWDKYFLKLQFDEPTHKYTLTDNNIQFTSVTQLLSTLKKDTFTDSFKQNYCNKHNLPYEYIDTLWKLKADIGALKGTEIHYMIESYFKWNIDMEVSILNTEAKQYFHNFLKDNKLRAIKLEYRVFDTDIKVAGSIDFLGYDLDRKCYCLLDWKSNKIINTSSREFLLEPVNNLQNTELNIYSLQLMLYKYILEKNIPELEIGYMKIVHLNSNNDNYKEYEVDYNKLKDSFHRFIDYRVKQITTN